MVLFFFYFLLEGFLFFGFGTVFFTCLFHLSFCFFELVYFSFLLFDFYHICLLFLFEIVGLIFLKVCLDCLLFIVETFWMF